MTELSENFLNLEISDPIFKDIRYFITGEVHEKIENLLKSGGAEHQNYFSDYVTHLIVGKNPEENDLTDANDLYEIPAITPQWVIISAKLKARLDTKPYLHNPNPKLFEGQIFCLSKLSEDRIALWGLITYNGGVIHNKLTNTVNFLVTGDTDTPKYARAESLGPEKIKVVTPDWILEAINSKFLPDPALYHPKLIMWPKPQRPSTPTTAITGFEPDTPESQKLEIKAVPDSTQALLEKLKQRMPWNQPPPSTSAPTSTSSDPIAPPNVVAPSFLSKLQSNQASSQPSQVPKSPVSQMVSVSQARSQPSAVVSSFAATSTPSPTHVPRSIVHHIPNSQQNQPSVLQHNPLSINRLIGQQPTPRSTLQPIRSQLNSAQIHQQLLQQRIQQQNQQNLIQRTSTGQININQQLLHQQLSQGQRQALQNQLINQQGLINQQQGLINQQHQQQALINQQQGLINQQQGLVNQQQGLNQLNQAQQGQNQLVDQQNQPNQQTQVIQNQLLNQPNQSPNQLINPQQSPQRQQIMSPQHNQQIQNQLIRQNQQNHLLDQQQNQLLNQTQVQNQQSHIINQQQNQLLNQQQNQLMSQQQRVLLNQQQNQNQQNQIMNQQNQLMNQSPQHPSQQNQLIGQQTNQMLSQSPQSQDHQSQMLNQQNQMLSMSPRMSPSQNQLHNQLLSPQSQMMQAQNQLINQQNQIQVSQQSQNQLITQGQLIQQGSQIISQGNQQNLLSIQQNQHLNQLNPQQIQQLQQLKREQQQLINQSQSVGGLNQQNLNLGQQVLTNQNQNQQLMNQNQQIIVQNQPIQMSQANQQQIIQNRVIQQQNLNQQLNQGQSFGQSGLNQHLINQKQQLFAQQQVNTSQQQQIIQNQQNVSTQQQFVTQSQFEAIQQQKMSQNLNQGGQNQTNQTNINQMNVQALNQQLMTQNLGPQLNQQLLQQNQQSSLNQGGLNQNINQAISLDQNLGIITQQSGLSQTGLNQASGLNQQSGLNQSVLSQPGLNQNTINQGLNQGQMGQMASGMGQQVIRAQFPQQMLVSQGQQNQQSGPARAQLSQQIWAQPQQQGGPIQGQQIIRHPVAVQQAGGAPVGPRIQWQPGQQPGLPQRQFIQLDAQTHNQLQKMPPDQQALFVAKLQQKQRALQLARQVQQRGGGHFIIRGNVPPGLTTQQQVQWLQQQAKQQGIVLPPNFQQNLTPSITQQPPAPPSTPAPALSGASSQTPSLSPINQSAAAQAQTGPQFVGPAATSDQGQAHLRQYRLHQLQLQREQAQKPAQIGAAPLTPPAVVRPLGPPPSTADSTTNPQVQVNPKTKTALANMLSIKLQSGGTIGAPARPEGIPDPPSAAGTLRMMTAQHNAAINSKPQEIIALQQQRNRVISGPNGEVIKTPSTPLTPQREPPKLQFNQKAPVPVQHRVGPFYGHNPNLKLPPDLFLLGCIFVVVEVEDYLEKNIPGWQQKIEKYGGEVEKQYCSKVTHVLCETQRHGVVMQALRDCKRCITIRWLSDVIKRKQVLPPWTALHLPQIYLDVTPASKHLISISGFEGNTRNMVKQMIRYTGAKCTTYFSKHNTLLICAKGEGDKYNHAKKWGIPVVNVQWLTDVILGNFSALNQMDNQNYQTFPTPPNLSFDPKLVPVIMNAWKSPINISQESYERVKRSASPVALPKPKKQKTEHTDENENITEEVTNSDYKILFSQFETEKLKKLENIVRELGGTVAKDHADFTHLVVSKLTRTTKLLFALTKSRPILPEKWLEESSAAKNFLPESEFHLHVDEFNEFNSIYGCTLEKTLLKGNRNRLLDGKHFWVTPSVIPSKKIICELIKNCGGTVERIRRSRVNIDASCSATPFTYFILTTKEDLHLVADLLKNKKDKQNVICNVELVLSAILKQHFEVEPYAVNVV